MSFRGRYQISAVICLPLFLLLFLSIPLADLMAGGLPGYAGSQSCQDCHGEIYRQWSMTPHANMLRDAGKTPDAIMADKFSPEIPFRKKDITHVVGSHWVQKYLTEIDGELYVLPKYWNIPQRDWEPYSIFNWRKNPYSINCYGCHTVGFDVTTKTYTEESIGCEACHGPGQKHVESQDPEDIVDPADLSKELYDMICESCHTDGNDMIDGTYPFAAGFQPGEHIDKYFTKFFLPKPRSKGWYKGDSTYEDRHRMYMFWQSKFYSSIRACDVCGFDRGLTGEAEVYMSRSEYCQTCHYKYLESMDKHAKHDPAQVGCTDCHVPQVADGGRRYSIHDHRFDFSRDEVPCTECHDPETAAKEPPPQHDFNFKPVETPKNISLEEACLNCHPDMIDVEEKMKSLRFRM